MTKVGIMFLSDQMKRELDDRMRLDISPEFAERIIKESNAVKLYEIKRCICVNISNVEWIHVAYVECDLRDAHSHRDAIAKRNGWKSHNMSVSQVKDIGIYAH